MKSVLLAVGGVLMGLAYSAVSGEKAAAATRPATTRAASVFGIRVVDEESGRGVPLVELTTVSHVCHVTDSGICGY